MWRMKGNTYPWRVKNKIELGDEKRYITSCMWIQLRLTLMRFLPGNEKRERDSIGSVFTTLYKELLLELEV